MFRPLVRWMGGRCAIRCPTFAPNPRLAVKRLQTYFAILVTIFTLAGSLHALFISEWYPTGNFLLMAWAIVVGGTFAFILSLVIGHYLADPLEQLHAKALAVRHGNANVAIRPEGKLYEADLLAEDMAALSELSRVQLRELAVQQRRQTQFISDAAHELRTPLTAIRGNAEMLLDPDLPPELHDRFCRTIVSEAERLSRLSNDLLALQRIEGGFGQAELERVNLHDVAERVLESLDSVIRESGARAEVTGEAPDVLGNPDHLHQVLFNLVSNAVRFVGEGGRITVRLEGLANQSVISVVDDGPGFGDVDPKMLFTRFYRGDNSRARNSGGTGLGLSIVKSIVDQHDGTIEAFNVPEGGACFIVALPSVQERVA